MSDQASFLSADVAVVGRGAIGAATALVLARQGRSVALVGPEAVARERVAPGLDNRVFALSPASRQLLGSLGVWQALEPARLAPVYDMHVHAEQGQGARALDFSAYEAAVEALAWIVEGGDLTRALNQALGFSSIRRLDSTVTRLDLSGPAHAILELANGQKVRARLVVGADGADSSVRRLAGIEAKFADYPQRAIVANFETAQPHRDAARQWFGEQGVLALLPLPSPDSATGGGRTSIVWSAPLELADELLALAPDQLATRIEALCGASLGTMRPLSRVDSYPLRLGQVSRLIGLRVAVVGDAAHVVHPLAGQGMNLGFGDIASLRDALAGAPDPGERAVLRRYERSRAEPVLTMRLLTDALQKLFDPGHGASLGALAGPLRAARDLGWRIVSESGWLRRRLIEHAARQ